MNPKELLAARRRSRERKVDLGDGKSVTFMRIPETVVQTMLTGDGDQRTFSVNADNVRKYVIGWDGFIESDFLEAGVGGSDVVPFDAALWDDMVTDNVRWIGVVSRAILDSIVDHYAKKAEVEKNSAPA